MLVPFHEQHSVAFGRDSTGFQLGPAVPRGGMTGNLSIPIFGHRLMCVLILKRTTSMCQKGGRRKQAVSLDLHKNPSIFNVPRVFLF